MTPREAFEALYRANSESPDFIINDMLVKGADGEYWHQATRTAFIWFTRGLNHEKA